MANINFEPWKPAGENPRFNGVRLLILGESHYDEGETYPPEGQKEFTQYIVKRWGAEAEGYQRFFNNIYATLNGDGAHWSSNEYKRFWSRVFFYNYVQSFVPGGARERPTGKMFDESADAFHAVLDDVKPEAVLVMGKKTWKKMSERDATRVGRDEDGLGAIWRYQYSGGACFAAHTRHPSSHGYSPAKWRPKALRFLDAVRSGQIPTG